MSTNHLPWKNALIFLLGNADSVLGERTVNKARTINILDPKIADISLVDILTSRISRTQNPQFVR